MFFQLKRLFGTAKVIKRLIVNRDSFWLRPWWSGSRPAVVVQSYIQGHPANCAVVCHEGRVLAGIAVEVVCATGPTEPAMVVRVVDGPDMMLAAHRIANRLRLSGFFGLDFIIEEGTGATYLIELNPRSTPLCHLRLGRCRDMVGALMARLLGQPLPDSPAITQSDLIAYFPQAYQANSPWLQSSFHDIPSGEPELARDLLNPWLERTFFARHFDSLYHWTRRLKSRVSNGRQVT
jgi:predicted ATP-grasp superfamily ATP-dependent carboligase